MNKSRYLNGTGKGEFMYDYKNDLLMFKVKDREYKHSLEFENFVVDIDEHGFVTGLRVFDASKLFELDKIVLRNIHEMGFKAIIENNTITISLKFISELRNKSIPLENFTQRITTPILSEQLQDSVVECGFSS